MSATSASEPSREQTTGRAAALVWVVLAAALATAGLVGSVWRPTAPALPVVATDLAGFDDDVLRTVAAYRGPRVPLAVLGTVLSVAVPVALACSPWGRALVHRLAGRGSAWRAGVVAGVLAVLVSVSVLPLAAWSGLVRDGRWGFRTASAGAWLLDWTVRASGRWVVLALGAVLLAGAVRRWPRTWPYRATVVATLVAGLGVALHPVVLLPLTLPTDRLEDPAQAAAVAPALEAAGDPDLPVFVGRESERSTRVNALATGLGPTARIVVYDNLLELDAEQVAAVVAHEIAHHEHRDLLRGVLLVATAVLPAGLVLRWVLNHPRVQHLTRSRRPGDARVIAVGLAVVAVLELVGQPAANLVSRRAEAAADARAVELTGDPATLVATTRIFTVRDLATPEPPAWITVLYRSHPSVGDRIRQAVAVAERDGLPVPERADLDVAERRQHHPAIAGGTP